MDSPLSTADKCNALETNVAKSHDEKVEIPEISEVLSNIKDGSLKHFDEEEPCERHQTSDKSVGTSSEYEENSLQNELLACIKMKDELSNEVSELNEKFKFVKGK